MRCHAILAVIVAAMAMASTSAHAQLDASRSAVTVATASPGGNYFLTGNAICRELQRQGHFLDSGDVTLINCAAMPTGGSIQNVDLVRNKIVNVALLQSDWHFHAYSGTDRFTGRKVDQLRSLVAFNREAFQLVAARGTGITGWPDVKGKKVNVGPTGSTAHSMFQELFKAHGVDEKWLTQALRLPPTVHVQEMCEGNVEVLAQTSGVPNAGIADAIRRCGATLVSLETPEIQKLIDDLVYYTPVTVPRGTYSGQVSDARTFGVVATMVATSDMPDSIAYSIVRAVFEGLPDMQAAVPVLRGLTVDGMTTEGLTAPLHPGAARYYRERGFLRSQRPTASATPATHYAHAQTSEPVITTTATAIPALTSTGALTPAAVSKLTRRGPASKPARTVAAKKTR